LEFTAIRHATWMNGPWWSHIYRVW
jgi:hypothetical protein